MKPSILLLALFCFTISNAQKFKKIKGNGIKTTINRTTSDYDKIKVAGSFTVKLVAGKEGNIKIVGDENILEYIKTEVSNNVLSVGFDKVNNIQYKTTIEITIPFEKINDISFSGSGSITTFDSINVDNLNIKASGSGNIKFETAATTVKISRDGSGNVSAKGKASNLEINSTGSGNVNGSELISENVTAKQSGSGNVKVHCTNNLSVTNSGSGSVNFKGSPKKIEKNASGSGSISGS